MRLFVAMGLCVGALGCVTHGWHAAHADQHFSDAEAWAARFDDPTRDAWQKPDQVLAALALPPDAVVADVGAATGYFSVRLAKAAPKGRVFGVDIESSMVDYLAKRAEREGLTNLTAVLAAPDDAKLPEPVDLVIIVNTWHHLGDKVTYAGRLKRALRPGGRLAIIDFTKASAMGPPASAKFDAAQVTADLVAAGWQPQASYDFLPEQFFLVFQATP